MRLGTTMNDHDKPTRPEPPDEVGLHEGAFINNAVEWQLVIGGDLTNFHRYVRAAKLDAAEAEPRQHMHGIDVCTYCAEGDLAIAERDALKAENELLMDALEYVLPFAEGTQRVTPQTVKEWRKHAQAALAKMGLTTPPAAEKEPS